MKKHYLLSLITILGFFSWGTLSYGKPLKPIHKALKKIELEETQRSEIQVIRKAGKPIKKQLKKSVKEKMAVFNEALMVAEADPEELNKLHDQVVAAKTKLMKYHFGQIMKIRSILTPEQREEFAALLKKHKKKRD